MNPWPFKSGLILLVVLLLTAGVAGATSESGAGTDQSAQSIKARIEVILSNVPFHSKRTAYRHRYRNDVDAPEVEVDPPGWLRLFEWIGLLFGTLFEVLLWGIAVEAVVLLIVYRDRWLGLLQLARRRPLEVRLPHTLFGRDEQAVPLPEDVVGAAWALWQEGEARACLSLLYRGALVHLVLHKHIELPDSATEEDCLRAVIRHQESDAAGYFRNLTRTWQAAAYASRLPEQAQAEALCEQWRRHYGEPG